MKLKHLFLSTAVAIAAPIAASAITITDGSFATYTANLVPGSSVLYAFEPDQELTIFFSFSVSGFVEDLENASYGFFADQYTFDEFEVSGPVFGATATLSFTTDQPFTLGFFDGISNLVGTSLTFAANAPTAEPPVVPLPAAGALLLGALGALGGASALRRKKA